MRQTFCLTVIAMIAVLGQAAGADNAPGSPAAQQQAPTRTSQPESFRVSQPGAGQAVAAPVSSAVPAAPDKLAELKPSPDAKLPNAATVDQKTYVVGPQDVLSIVVFQQKELGGTSVVRPDGKITVPFGGEIQAAGRTPEQLTKDLSDRLSSVIRDPTVSVMLVQSNSRKYYIIGEVLKPGEYSLVMPIRVLQALVNAGGFKDFANTKNIRISRDNGIKNLKFNYKDVIQGKNLDQNVFLQPDDVIIVN